METRRLGKTGHQSTVVTFGTAALGAVTQVEADRAIDYALSRGINHFDLAPSYGEAELRLSDYLKRHPQPGLFISCKTNERLVTAAREELHRTLERIRRDRFDLYQLHAVCNMADLEACFASQGSMEAILTARQSGLVSHIGITGHGWDAARTHKLALEKFDFSTVMTACNLFMVQDSRFRQDWDDLVASCQLNDIGIHVLKATAQRAWGERPKTYTTWYEPLHERETIDPAIAWVLDQPVTTLCSASDPKLVPMICDAAERYTEINQDAQHALLMNRPFGDFFDAA